MFALEITFQDGVSQPEMVYVRRPQALIGSSDYAHVVIEDLESLGYQLRIVKDLGRSFRVKAVGAGEGIQVPDLGTGHFEGSATVNVGTVQIVIASLDIDLVTKEGEPPDRAGVRVLRQAATTTPSGFPAVLVRGADSMIISFNPQQPIYLGRSNRCAVRLDSADISGKHARLGFEGGEFWVEDLGSTNGTYVNGQQIAGRVNVAPATPIVLGREISISGVISTEQLQACSAQDPQEIEKPSARRYPVLLSVSEVARPARIVLPVDGKIVIGRDPACDMWLGAPHISRRHCEVYLSSEGHVIVKDQSTNGTAYDNGILRKDQTLEVVDTPKVLNFGGELTVALCFDGVQETSFLAAQGAADVFSGKDAKSSSQHEQPRENLAATLMQDELVDTHGGMSTINQKQAVSLIRRLRLVLQSIHPVGRMFLFLALFVVGVISALIGIAVFQRLSH